MSADRILADWLRDWRMRECEHAAESDLGPRCCAPCLRDRLLASDWLAAHDAEVADKARADALNEAASAIGSTCEGNYNPDACETCRAVERLRSLAAEGGSQPDPLRKDLEEMVAGWEAQADRIGHPANHAMRAESVTLRAVTSSLRALLSGQATEGQQPIDAAHLAHQRQREPREDGATEKLWAAVDRITTAGGWGCVRDVAQHQRDLGVTGEHEWRLLDGKLAEICDLVSEGMAFRHDGGGS